MSTKTSTVVTYRTRAGAANWITRLGYTPGVEAEETRRLRGEVIHYSLRFDVEPILFNGKRRYAVVRRATDHNEVDA